MSDTNRVALAYIEESTFGTTPSGNLNRMRVTSESLHQEAGFNNSQEIVSDRQITDVVRTSANGAGDIAFEVSYAAQDFLFQYALQSAGWSSVVTDTDTVYSMVNSTNSIDRSSGDFAADGFVANQWVEIRGFTGDTSNNGYYKIVSVASGSMVLSGGAVVDDAAGESVTITMGAQIVNGTTLTHMSIEKAYQDLSNIFAAYRGMSVDTLSLELSADSFFTGSVGLIGKNETSETSTIGTGYVAAPTNEVMSAIDSVQSILEAQTNQDTTAFSLELANNLRQRQIIGTLGPVSIGSGSLNITGALTKYFETAALLNKFLNNTTSSIATIVEDEAGNAYIIDLPNVEFTAGQRVAGGLDSDVVAEMEYTAYKHATEAITIRIVRFAA